MFSKFNINLQIAPQDVNETEFERYVREKSEQILKKCFKIKMPEPKAVDEQQIKKEMDNLYQEMLSQVTIDENSLTKPIKNCSKETKSTETEDYDLSLNQPPLKIDLHNDNIREMELLELRFENLKTGHNDKLKPLTLQENSELLTQGPGKTPRNNNGKESEPAKKSDNHKHRTHYKNWKFVSKSSSLQTVNTSTKQDMEALKQGISNPQTFDKPIRRALSQPSTKAPVVKTIKKSYTKIWKSPFISSITLGSSKRSAVKQQYSPFQYDLSREEQKFTAVHFRSPMKPAPKSERQILDSGQRREYLTQRYEHSPVFKYNYPEATSWRIGWLHQQQQHQHYQKHQ